MTLIPQGAQAGAQKVGKRKPASGLSKLEQRIDELEDQVDRLGAELDVLKAQSVIVVQRTHLGFLDKYYAKGGLSLLFPRGRTFTGRTDTGLGFFLGAGRYFGRSHVADLAFEWDLYPSAALRYRYEFHGEGSSLTFAPVAGVKVKLFDSKPIDNFIERPSDVRSVFAFVGLLAGLPLPGAMAVVEVLYLFNTQQVLTANFGVHLFL